MFLSSLEIENFRNLRRVGLRCSPGLNLILGNNAAGKTTLLEALFFLGRARSFRARGARELITVGEPAFRLVAHLKTRPEARPVVVGIERSAAEVVARIGGEPIRALAQLAAQVPVLLLNPDSHRLLEDGPKWRRRFMDWGLFQADALFIEAWRRYGAALRNRNGALRMRSDDRTVDAWDRELSKTAVALDTARQKFCASLQRQLSPLLEALLGGMESALEYRRGWSRDQDLRQALHASRDQDRRQGYTRLGPHRADFVVKLDGGSATERLSRGQQKLLIIALVLAQARLYQDNRGGSCMLLIDDLPSELDRVHRGRVMNCLARSDAQLFVTAIEPGALDTALWEESRVFHLAHGNVSLMT